MNIEVDDRVVVHNMIGTVVSIQDEYVGVWIDNPPCPGFYPIEFLKDNVEIMSLAKYEYEEYSFGEDC